VGSFTYAAGASGQRDISRAGVGGLLRFGGGVLIRPTRGVSSLVITLADASEEAARHSS